MTVPTVFIVEDDALLARALARLLREHGWQSARFASAEEFLAAHDPCAPGCLLLDVELPGLDGISLQQRLAERRSALPIVFLTGHGDIPMTVRALKRGALDFLTKPVAAAALLAAVSAAVAQNARHRADQDELADARRRYESLSEREREVLAGVLAGRLNKQIAAELGVVEQTVKYHRARIAERMQTRTTAELMHLVARLRLGPPAGPGTEGS
ncbi:MAG TPA: response regulator [Burkholderiaceae bacterium]|nr:response regulator [Burkholderiaceae bacterium]